MGSVADRVAEALATHGVERVFGFPGGGSNLALIDALERAGVAFVLTRARGGRRDHGRRDRRADRRARASSWSATGPASPASSTGSPTPSGSRAAARDLRSLHRRRARAHRPPDPRSARAAGAGRQVERHARAGDRGRDGRARARAGECAPRAARFIWTCRATSRARPAVRARARVRCPAPLLPATSAPSLAGSPRARAATCWPWASRRARWTWPRSPSASGAAVLTTYKAKGALPEDHPRWAGILTGGEIERPVLERSDAVLALGLDPVELLSRPWTARRPFTRCARATGASATCGRARTGSARWRRASRHSGKAPAAGRRPRSASEREAMLARLRLGDPGASISRRSRDEASARHAVVSVDAGAHMFPATAFWRAERGAS